MIWLKKMTRRVQRWITNHLFDMAVVVGCPLVLVGACVFGVWMYRAISRDLKAAPRELTALEKAQSWVTKAGYGYTQCRGNSCTHAQKNSDGQIYVIHLWCNDDSEECYPY